MRINLEELAQLIVKAKKKTYAGEGEGKRESDNSKNLQYEEGNYVYRDRYFGSERFGGEEIVWCKQEPVWLMNYNGGITERVLDSKAVFIFLRQALMQVPIEKPFRGPPSFRTDDLEYRNSVLGDITWFKGTEEILHRGKTIYKVDYSGGIIK